MATIHRLNSDWTLTDGIIDPIRLDRPRTVYDALRRENLVPDAHYGMNSTACEWIYNRTFIYEKQFDLPPSDDTERTELHFEHMYGECTVLVNGQRFEPFAPGRYDITAAAADTNNLLQVVVPPAAFGGGIPAPTGIAGSVSVTGTNRITVLSAGFFAANELGINLLIDAHISGKYHFECVLSREGEAIATHELHRRMTASRQAFQLNFPLPENAAGMYDVQLTITLNGLLCERLRETVSALPAREPEAICALYGNDEAEDSILAALPHLKDAGFDAVSLAEPVSRRMATRLQELELTAVPAEEATCFTGCMDADTLRKYADGRRCWPADAPVWKLRGDSLPDAQILEAAFGSIPAGNADRVTASVRLLQAQQVFDSIIRARLNGETPVLGIDIDPFPHFASASLWDDGTPRPALYAAKQALQPLIAVPVLPEGPLPCGTVLKFPVTLLARRDVRPLPVTVTAAMYAPDGSLLAGTSFAAVPGGAKPLGELNCEIPRSLSHALLRVTVELPGESPVITDRWIACGDTPMTPTALPAAAISDGVNGGSLAYCAVTGNGIRHLLPGEAVTGFTGEYFNR